MYWFVLSDINYFHNTQIISLSAINTTHTNTTCSCFTNSMSNHTASSPTPAKKEVKWNIHVPPISDTPMCCTMQATYPSGNCDLHHCYTPGCRNKTASSLTEKWVYCAPCYARLFPLWSYAKQNDKRWSDHSRNRNTFLPEEEVQWNIYVASTPKQNFLRFNRKVERSISL